MNEKLKEINYKDILSTHNIAMSDVSYFNLIVYERNYKKEITRIAGFRKDSITSIMKWLEDCPLKIKLIKSTKAFTFEAMYPHINIKDVNFPPKDLKKK